MQHVVVTGVNTVRNPASQRVGLGFGRGLGLGHGLGLVQGVLKDNLE